MIHTQIYYYTLVSFEFYYVNDNKTNINNKIKVIDAKRRQTSKTTYTVYIVTVLLSISIEQYYLSNGRDKC